MRDEFLVFGSPVIGEEEIAEVVDSLRSGWVGTGPKVQRFEAAVADYLGVPHCPMCVLVHGGADPVDAGAWNRA